MKTKKTLTVLSISAGSIIAALLFFYFAAGRTIRLAEISDCVFETGVLKKTNQKLYDMFTKYVFCGNASGCSCAVKTLDGGDTIVGRNMDFYISNKPAFIVRTAEKNKYRTTGIAYFNEFIPDSKVVRKHGLPRIFLIMLPLFCQDVMNEKGLYVEVNMRYSEPDENGNLKFLNTHTNPASRQRSCTSGLNTRIAQNCATVEEAVEYIRGLDLYSPSSPDMSWNFCYILADANGKYGLVEVADNKVYYQEGQPAQTNFYVAKELYPRQQMKCGVGRYEKLMQELPLVKSEGDMFSLMDSVTYAQSYNYEECRFDARTEFIGEKPGWTYDYLMDEKNQAEVTAYMKSESERFKAYTRQGLMDDGSFWESSFTTVANCTRKTMRVRFFEDNGNVVALDASR